MSVRRRLQLAGFAQYCGARIEREQGIAIDTWMVQLTADPAGWRARVEVRLTGLRIDAVGRGPLPDAAIWEAMCRIEQPLRDTRHTPRAA